MAMLGFQNEELYSPPPLKARLPPFLTGGGPGGGTAAPRHDPGTRARLCSFGLLLPSLRALGRSLNWPLMKIVLRDAPPLPFRGGCLLPGGLGVRPISFPARKNASSPSCRNDRIMIRSYSVAMRLSMTDRAAGLECQSLGYGEATCGAATGPKRRSGVAVPFPSCEWF